MNMEHKNSPAMIAWNTTVLNVLKMGIGRRFIVWMNCAGPATGVSVCIVVRIGAAILVASGSVWAAWKSKNVLNVRRILAQTASPNENVWAIAVRGKSGAITVSGRVMLSNRAKIAIQTTVLLVLRSTLMLIILLITAMAAVRISAVDAGWSKAKREWRTTARDATDSF